MTCSLAVLGTAGAWILLAATAFLFNWPRWLIAPIFRDVNGR